MVTPAAAKLAKDLGLDLEGVEGSGKGGKITVGDVRAAAEARPLTVVEAVTRDLEAFGQRKRGLDRSGLAASALALAQELDKAKNSATSKSMCARALIDTLDRLEAMAPAKPEADKLDELSSRRAARRAGSAAAKG